MVDGENVAYIEGHKNVQLDEEDWDTPPHDCRN